MNDTPPMIEVTHASKRYPGGYDALRAVSFSLAQGEMAFLTGHSGAGKSTLLRLISLIERPTRGQIVVNGRNLARLSNRQVPYFRREIGVVFQDNRLLNDRSVYDNVALPLIVAGADPNDIPRRVRAALDKVGLLDKEKHLPLTLSGGQQQRVGIARAVVSRPPLLLADEPTGNLDPATGARVRDVLLELNHDCGSALVVATHNHELAASMGRVLRLLDGRLAPVAVAGAVGRLAEGRP